MKYSDQDHVIITMHSEVILALAIMVLEILIVELEVILDLEQVVVDSKVQIVDLETLIVDSEVIETDSKIVEKAEKAEKTVEKGLEVDLEIPTMLDSDFQVLLETGETVLEAQAPTADLPTIITEDH